MQRFAVRYEYPVVFTRDLFATQNPSFATAIVRAEPDRVHRMLVTIDSNVADAWPDLPSRIASYAAAFPHVLALVAPPVVLPGGGDGEGL